MAATGNPEAASLHHRVPFTPENATLNHPCRAASSRRWWPRKVSLRSRWAMDPHPGPIVFCGRPSHHSLVAEALLCVAGSL